MSVAGFGEVGLIQVHTSSNGGHPPEFWAERAMAKLITVADSTPPPIRDQVMAFRAQMQAIILASINNAVASERAKLLAELNRS